MCMVGIRFGISRCLDESTGAKQMRVVSCRAEVEDEKALGLVCCHDQQSPLYSTPHDQGRKPSAVSWSTMPQQSLALRLVKCSTPVNASKGMSTQSGSIFALSAWLLSTGRFHIVRICAMARRWPFQKTPNGSSAHLILSLLQPRWISV